MLEKFIEFAAAIAPIVDRHALAVHRQARVHHADEARQWVAETKLSRPGILINLRPFILAGAESREVLEALHRYETPRMIEQEISEARREGLFDDDFRASPRAVRLSQELTELHRRSVEELWDGRPEVARLVPRLSRVVDDIPLRDPGRGFELSRAFCSLPRPTESEAWLLHHLLTILRYFRSDCHAEIIEEAELSPAEAEIIEELWRDNDVDQLDHNLVILVQRGLVTDDGRLTDRGRSFRDAIEHETNTAAAGVWEVLDDAERDATRADLTALPDHV